MSFIYTRAQLKSRINAGIHGKIGMLVSAEDTMNETVRDVNQRVDIRSTRRRSTLTPNLYNGIFDYAAPTDLKGYGLIDIPAQAKRSDGSFFFIPTEEFEVKKPAGAVAIDDYNGTRVLKVNSRLDDDSYLISELDALTAGGGTWSLFGDGETLAADTDDYIKGNGSIKWNISAAGGTTAGIQNTGLNSFDLTDYLGGNGSAFVWVKINSITDLTNFILRLGNDSSNYYSKTITTQHDGTAFTTGWNLLRFDLTSLTETGTVTDTAIDYAAIYMTKATTKVSETDYKFDWLVLKKGEVHYVKYYSKYGWQTSAGAYQENSSADEDLLVADNDEFNLFVKRGRYIAAQETDLPPSEIDRLREEYEVSEKAYALKNPSETKIMTNEYYAY